MSSWARQIDEIDLELIQDRLTRHWPQRGHAWAELARRADAPSRDPAMADQARFAPLAARSACAGKPCRA